MTWIAMIKPGCQEHLPDSVEPDIEAEYLQPDEIGSVVTVLGADDNLLPCVGCGQSYYHVDKPGRWRYAGCTLMPIDPPADIRGEVLREQEKDAQASVARVLKLRGQVR